MKKSLLIGSIILISSLYGEDGEQIYKRCVACHGLSAEKNALGTSRVIADFDEHEIVNAINGYKEERYGGKLKYVMREQMKYLDSENIKSVAYYIAHSMKSRQRLNWWEY
jgi:cytochrome c